MSVHEAFDKPKTSSPTASSSTTSSPTCPGGLYYFLPTGEPWAASGVNKRLPSIIGADGKTIPSERLGSTGTGRSSR